MATSHAERKIFHESWYRIAKERLALRASVRVRRQLFRGARWYVLHEPFNDRFFRLRPPAWEFVCRLDSGHTVEEVWGETMERDPENAPGQEEVIQLLSQLFYANLLHCDLPPDSRKLFERYKERKQSERRATLRSIMFFRIPLFDPNGLLKRLLPIIRLIMSPVGAALWVAALVGGAAVVLGHFAEVRVQAQGLLSLSNIPLLYLSLISIKALHELGHAMAVRRFGGDVHTIGIMFLIFNPLPYTDSTAAWSFRSKWQRVLVGAAGMIVELFIAGLAAFVWVNSGPGTLHALAYNMMFVASVSTVVFNINPLMRFDGYYILSDLLDIPNLNARSALHLRHLVERYAFGYKKSESPTGSSSEAVWLTIFGITSGLYRVVVFSTILLVIADRFLLLGILMAAVCAIAWVVTPLLRLVHYLAASPRLERTRLRSVGVCLGAAAALTAILALVPFPNNFRSPGVLQASKHEVVANGVAGQVESVVVQSDTRVERGQVLLRLTNPDLQFEMKEVQAHIQEAESLREKALYGDPAGLQAIDSTIQSIRQQLDHIEHEQADLLVRAGCSGIWIAPRARDIKGAWIQRGTAIGDVIDDSSFHFSSVISEENASSIFSPAIRGAQVRLSDSPGLSLEVTRMVRIPVQQTRLPSEALGFQGGGNVATEENASNVASEPFYELRLDVAKPPNATLYHGLSGEVRFRLKPETLLEQGYRKLRQLLQARYQI